jgi:FKBP-type peptidyl-prolyl cis-trans isomerase SlyD
MKIGKDKVVSINYTLKDAKGEIIDTSDGRVPLDYIHGSGNIIQGLENALKGKSAGDELSVTIPPEEAYGPRDDSLAQSVDRKIFETEEELEVGMQFQTPTEQGTMIVTIAGIDGDIVTVDSNHPLAGEALHFDVAVVDVRDATEEELTHGHAHGPEGSCEH